MSKALSEIQESDGAVSHHATFKNYRSTLNRINEHYGWEKDVVHYELLEKHALELPGLCGELWEINNTQALKTKLRQISSLVTRAMGTMDHRITRLVRTVDKEHSVEAKVIPRDIREWPELQSKLAEYGVEDSTRGIIALVFSHGYVLRVGEIFDTKVGLTSDDDQVNNHLDLEACTWTIRKHKKGYDGAVREFAVSKEFIDALPRRSGWLLRKRNGLPYVASSARTLKYHNWWPDLPSNRDIRASFETWNIANGQLVSHEEVIGHTKTTAETYYDKSMMNGKKKIKITVRSKHLSGNK